MSGGPRQRCFFFGFEKTPGSQSLCVTHRHKGSPVTSLGRLQSLCGIRAQPKPPQPPPPPPQPPWMIVEGGGGGGKSGPPFPVSLCAGRPGIPLPPGSALHPVRCPSSPVLTPGHVNHSARHHQPPWGCGTRRDAIDVQPNPEENHPPPRSACDFATLVVGLPLLRRDEMVRFFRKSEKGENELRKLNRRIHHPSRSKHANTSAKQAILAWPPMGGKASPRDG